MYDYIIVGAGPAGLQMGYFMEKAGKSYVILEKNGTPGSMYETQPRHRTLISINKRFNYYEEDNYNMRHDWNSLLSDDTDLKFTKYSDELFPPADTIVQYMRDFASRFRLNISYNTIVTNISKSGDVFSVKCNGNTLKSKVVIMANGALKEYNNIEGIENATTYGTHTIDRDYYNDKLVAVVGAGNSGFEVSNHIAGNASVIHSIIGNKSLTLSWNSHFVGDLRAINNTILDMNQLNTMHRILAVQATKIEQLPCGKKRLHMVELQTHLETPGWSRFFMDYDEIIVCTGWKYVDESIFDKDICPATIKNGRYPDLSGSWESTTPGLYYIGAAMAGKDRKSASGFIHGFRYNTRTVFNFLQEKYSSVPLPHVTLKQDLAAIADKILERVSTNDAIYQMNNFLCDLIVIKENDVEYYTELPKTYVYSNWKKFGGELYMVTLNYGFDKFPEAPIDFVHGPDFSHGNCMAFLHPFVTYIKSGKYIDHVEITESLLLRFDKKGDEFQQWSAQLNATYFKDFINQHQQWTTEVFDLTSVTDDFANFFVPLTKEEIERIPNFIPYKEGQCRTGIGGLMPAA